uniref:Hypothethical protein (Modular protein) n=1 Tax=Ralstonia solanacearum TaxID=305 RepID=A0A0S4X611_RALSL|nr:Hypothethical protein (modular protein) [Ralstonia solanacearum]
MIRIIQIFGPRLILIQTMTGHPCILKVSKLLTDRQLSANEFSDGVDFELNTIQTRENITMFTYLENLLPPCPDTRGQLQKNRFSIALTKNDSKVRVHAPLS